MIRLAALALVLAGGVLAASPVRAAEPPGCPAPTGCGGLLGRVRVAGERVAVEGARVVVMPLPAAPSPGQDAASPPWTVGTVTDAEGRFVLREVPSGPVRVVVLLAGYERLDAEAVVVRGANVALELHVRRVLADDYRTVVESRRAEQTTEARSTLLSREEVQTMPGTQGDALRALQNLPGVARPPAGLGLLVLRGAPPGQSLTLLGEHPVPRAFHALPLAAVVQSEALDGLELRPSNASARYGPLTGGVVQLQPHRPRRDGLHGHGAVDLTGASAAMEGPLGPGSFMVAARRGWIDAVLLAVERVDPQRAYTLPGLWDYQAWLVLPALGGELELRSLGAGDRVRSRSYDPSLQDAAGVFDFRSQFHRFDAVGRWTVGRTRLLVSPTLRIQRDHATLIHFLGVARREVVPGWRAELDAGLAPWARLVVGTDGAVSPYRAELHRADFGQRGEVEHTRGHEATSGAYVITHFGRGGWRVSPGLRAQAFVFGSARHAALDPRLDGRVQLGDRVSLDLGVGRYSQLAVVQASFSGDLVDRVIRSVAPTVLLPPALTASFEPRVPLDAENIGARVTRATQASASMEVELPWQLELRVGAFVRRFDDPGAVAVPVDGGVMVRAPKVVTHDYGGELLLRRRLTKRLYGWVAYTLMRSFVRRDDAGPIPGDFDQPHNLVALLSVRLPRDWRIGGRFRVTSGNPYRPLVGVASSEDFDGSSGLIPLYGAPNSARFPTFHQLDVRVDKQWILPRATFTAYLDVQNVYNQENVEAWIHQLDLRGRAGVVGLPILPVLGLRVDL